MVACSLYPALPFRSQCSIGIEYRDYFLNPEFREFDPPSNLYIGLPQFNYSGKSSSEPTARWMFNVVHVPSVQRLMFVDIEDDGAISGCAEFCRRTADL